MRIVAMLFLVGCTPDATWVEEALAAGSTAAMPVSLSAAALVGQDVPCAEVVQGCEQNPCTVSVEVTLGEDCPFPYGVGTGTVHLAGNAEPDGSSILLYEMGVDLSDVRIDGRAPLVTGATAYAEPGGNLGYPNLTWVIEAYADSFSVTPQITQIDLRGVVHTQGTPDPADDTTVLEGSVDAPGGDGVEVRDVTWESTCRANPVSGTATRRDETIMGTRDKQVVTFHPECDGMVDIDGTSVAIDLVP